MHFTFLKLMACKKGLQILVSTSEEAMYTGQFILIHGPLYFSPQGPFDDKKYGSI